MASSKQLWLRVGEESGHIESRELKADKGTRKEALPCCCMTDKNRTTTLEEGRMSTYWKQKLNQ